MENLTCKYCGSELKKIAMPPDSDWGADYLHVCMNDDCSYYVRGWDWMYSKYNVVASYRYKFNPVNNDFGPIPVKTPADLKHYVIE